jgi:hypothetical protein
MRAVAFAAFVSLTSALPSAAAPPQGAPPAPPVLSTTPTPPAGSMSSPVEMSGFPLQVGDLPPGILSVRVIRQSFANSVTGQAVEVLPDGAARPLGGTTNAEGRAQFSGLAVGQTVQVRATVDGERLESQRFQMPAQGGVRIVLVAGAGAGTDAATAPAWPVATAAAAATGTRGDTTASMTRLYVALPLAALSFGAGTVLWRRRPARAAHSSVRARRTRTFEALVQLEMTRKEGAPDAAVEERRERLVRELIAIDAELDGTVTDRSRAHPRAR